MIWRQPLKNPFEIFFYASCTLSGTLTLVKLSPPSSIQSLLPFWTQVVWSVFIALGGAMAFAGVFYRSGRPFWTQIGLALVGNGCLFYAAAVIYFTAKHHALFQGAFPSGLTLAFGAACLWRYIQIERAVIRLRRVEKGA